MELYKMNEKEQQRSADFDWAMTAPEVQEHAGKLVAVYRKRVVGVGMDRLALMHEAAAREQCDPWDITVIEALSLDPLEIPH